MVISIDSLQRQFRSVAGTLGLSIYREIQSDDPNVIEAFIGEKKGFYQVARASRPNSVLELQGEAASTLVHWDLEERRKTLIVTRCDPGKEKRILRATFDGTVFEGEATRFKLSVGAEDWEEEDLLSNDFDRTKLLTPLRLVLQSLNFVGIVTIYYDVAQGMLTVTGWEFEHGDTNDSFVDGDRGVDDNVHTNGSDAD